MGLNRNTSSKDADAPRIQKGFLQATKYLDSHLNPDEFPLYRAHLSWIPVFIHQIPFMLIGGLAGGITWGMTQQFIIGFGIFLGAWLIGILSQAHQCYMNIATDILITNQGIHSKKKLIAIEDDQFTRFGYINDAKLDYKNLIQHAFQYGNVEISTISGADDNYMFKHLAKPATFKNVVRAAQQRYSSGSGFGGSPSPQSSSPKRGRKKGGKRRESESNPEPSTPKYSEVPQGSVPTRHPNKQGPSGEKRKGRPNQGHR